MCDETEEMEGFGLRRRREREHVCTFVVSIVSKGRESELSLNVHAYLHAPILSITSWGSPRSCTGSIRCSGRCCSTLRYPLAAPVVRLSIRPTQ